MMSPITTALIITAAGNSSRFGTEQKKEYLALQSKLFPLQDAGTVLSCSLEPFLIAFQNNPNFALTRLIITVPSPANKYTAKAHDALLASAFVKQKLKSLDLLAEFTEGGNSRQESVYKALCLLAGGGKKNEAAGIKPDLVLIHDGARPFASAGIILSVLNLCMQKGAAVPALMPSDTQKETDKTGKILRHLDRSLLAAVQTPQAFRFVPLLAAYKKAAGSNKFYTDDSEIWGNYAGDVYTCEGSPENIKITFKQDMEFANTAAKQNAAKTVMRIGTGYDLHRLVKNRPLKIGGVNIPFEMGESAHSDGDVLLHAVIDALLGAAALGDIGEMFPPSDNRWKDADSNLLLKIAWQKIKEAGWQLENLDCVVNLEKPKFLPWREEVCSSIAAILDCETRRIFVKAKTGEGLGSIGKGKAVAAWANCLLKKQA